MDIPKVITELEMEMEESQNQRDARVEQLWMKLDYQRKGELDWKGLQKGLRRIDHPMKNADDMLKAIIKVVDTNGDGKIQYEEFRIFVEAAERQLYVLFKSIDRDQNGKLDKEELHHAVQHAGLSVPIRRLDEFFENIDHNRDGYITYEEWRNFLLFMPNTDPTTTLRAVFTFYTDILTLNSEGDSVVSEETLQGLGTNIFYTLFGSILRLASSSGIPRELPSDQTSTPLSSRDNGDLETTTTQLALASDDRTDMSAIPAQPYVHPVTETTATIASSLAAAEQAKLPAAQGIEIETGLSKKSKRSVLIQYLPDPGYFVAGAVAGGVSRTTTAPLDRLKVYLLVNTTSSGNIALEAAKKGQAIKALKHAGGPFITAVADIWKAGGIRGFFAGNGLNVVKIMPETAIRFGAYEAAKKALASFEGHNDMQRINPYSKFVAGGVAGMTAQFFVYPLDTLKFRLQSDYVSGGARGNALLLETTRKMWSEGGVRAAYRGVTMGLVGMFPYSAIDMGTFELLKNTYVTYQARAYSIHEEDAQPTTFATGIMGATSGAFGASVVYPLNVLRTRLQTQGTSMHPAHYTGIWDVAQKTIKNEGFRGLYKGLMPNLLKVAPALSITWMVYENTKKILHLN
ncbi:mitochondrial carrier [Hypoxylon sp. NC1633]|nr:mitochondrial carrier [Hypoxylon sp. NC1633]